MHERPDALVIGGGLIGLAIAWRASVRGLRVTVVDPHPGEGASWAAAGMLAPVSEAHFGEDALTRLNVAGAAAYPAFIAELEAETDVACGYRRCGTLMVGLDADDMRVLDDVAGLQRGLGQPVERLGGRACRELEPMLSPAVAGGIHIPGDHQVDNRRLLRALTVAVENRATLLRQRVAELLVAADRVEGVILDDGRPLPAPAVVLAAGCWSGEVAGIPRHARPPVRPVKGQVLRLRVPLEPPLFNGTIRWLAQGSPGYLVPRSDGEVVLGATSEERGFDTEVTAGGVFQLLRDAYRVAPGITEAVLTESRAGLRPGSPDNAPMLGRSGLEGLLVATGHHRNGVLLTPLTGRVMAALLAGDDVDPVAAPFTPDRFAAPAAVA
ncbi:MAG: glycine oxidase ThiO [Candidatus Dormibacteria bacterium]